jgi:hypothetical protein
MPKTFLDKNNNALYTGYETHEIVANPTLEGDEETLEGLEIGSTKYKVGGGSGTEVILGAELVALEGKHIDVDKLIALVQKYDLDNQEKNLFVGLNGNSLDDVYADEASLISFYNNSGIELCVLVNYLSQSLDYSGEDSLITMLTNNKLVIEGVIIQEFSSDWFKWATSIFQPTIRKYAEDSTIIIITKQEILDLFVD